jgi:hypothetical protein
VLSEVEAPDGSGVICSVTFGWLCFGRVPEVDGVGDECGELDEDESLELASDGGAGGATGSGGTWAVAGVVGAPNVGPNGCSLGIEVQLYWNSGTVSGSPVRNL